jgi:hypothetical protein
LQDTDILSNKQQQQHQQQQQQDAKGTGTISGMLADFSRALGEQFLFIRP